MKIFDLFLLFFLSGFSISSARVICNPEGNLIVYSNYDGGVLKIDIDQDIPDLNIGVSSYEPIYIEITGQYASNVKGVWYAGYNDPNMHNKCTTLSTTSYTGPTLETEGIETLPEATIIPEDQSSRIACSHTCDNVDGGCNSPEQLVDYFRTKLGGTLLYHKTQYGCFQQQRLSAGGNCCLGALSTGLKDDLPTGRKKMQASIIKNQLKIVYHNLTPDTYQLKLFDLSGATLNQQIFTPENSTEVLYFNSSNLENGIIFLVLQSGAGISTFEKIRVFK